MQRLKLSVFVFFLAILLQPNLRAREVKAIIIDKSLSKETLSAWLAYAGGRVKGRKDSEADRYTFEEEVLARSVCADAWDKLRKKGNSPDILYLNDLVLVYQAGFIREYTWVYVKDPAWNFPSGLRLEKFEAWRSSHLKGHQPQTRARVDY